jgi:putative hydrolase of the HAD superfamily
LDYRGRMVRAVLLDLDDTLVVEEAAAVGSFAAAAEAAGPDLDAAALALAARGRARELWRAAPAYPWAARIGISSWEALWCRFEGAGPQLRELRAWAPWFRREAWRLALTEQGVDDPALAEELGERFGVERRARHETFADAEPALHALREAGSALVLVTNGASCLQREKLAGSGLAGLLDAVVVSGDVGTGKPDPRIFARAVAAAGARPREAVMVGDNVAKDVEGALAAGLDAVWLNRDARPRPDGFAGRQIATLGELYGE